MVTVTHEEDGFTHVKYREDKRPLKIDVFIIDGPEHETYLQRIVKFVERESNAPQHVAKMAPEKYWPLVERLATLVCREFSPTTNWGVTKPEIRGAVLFILYAGIKAGTWPEEYEMTDKTFVQYGGERYE